MKTTKTTKTTKTKINILLRPSEQARRHIMLLNMVKHSNVNTSITKDLILSDELNNNAEFMLFIDLFAKDELYKFRKHSKKTMKKYINQTQTYSQKEYDELYKD